jgi:hypothetical protein
VVWIVSEQNHYSHFASSPLVLYFVTDCRKFESKVLGSAVMYRSCKNFVKFGQGVECLNETQTEFLPHKAAWIPFKEAKSAKNMRTAAEICNKILCSRISVPVQLSNSYGQIPRSST